MKENSQFEILTNLSKSIVIISGFLLALATSKAEDRQPVTYNETSVDFQSYIQGTWKNDCIEAGAGYYTQNKIVAKDKTMSYENSTFQEKECNTPLSTLTYNLTFEIGEKLNYNNTYQNSELNLKVVSISHAIFNQDELDYYNPSFSSGSIKLCNIG